MKTGGMSATLAGANAVLVALVPCFTPVARALGLPWVGCDWDRWHGFVLPHLALSGILLMFYGCAFLANVVEGAVRITAGWVQPFLGGTHFWAMRQWPGGDDSGGMS